jgi:tape measure domain-containing protein
MGQKMTTSITALNIRIATDASEVYEAGKRMSSTMRTVNQVMEASKTPIERYQQSLTRLDAAYSHNKITTEQYIRGVQQIGKSYDDLIRKQDEAAKKDQSTMGGMLANVKRLAAAYIGLQTGRSIVKIAADAEAASIQFEVLTGSAGEAARIIADMKKLAAASPLSLTGVQSGVKTLLMFNVSSKQAVDMAKRLADVTGGNEEAFKRLALAFGQANAAGRLMATEANQMKEAGFGALQAISDLTGESISDLFKKMEQGQIPFSLLQEALINATSGTGKFAGMTDRLSKTFTGSYQQMSGAAQDLAIAIGENILPTFTAFLNEVTKGIRYVTDTVNSFTALDRAVIAGGLAFVAAYSGVILITKGLVALKAAVTAAALAQTFLVALTGPAGWAIIAGAVAATAAAYVTLKNATEEAVPVQEASKAAVIAQTGAFKGLADSVSMAIAASKERDAAALVAAKMEDAAIKRNATLNASYIDAVHSLMMQRAELSMTKEAYESLQDASKGFSDQQREVLANLRAEIKALEDKKKAEEEAKKRQEELAKMLADSAKKAADFAREQIRQARERAKQQEEELTRTQQQALEAAKRHFEEQRRKQMEMRSAVARGPSGFEVGSSEAMRFLAEQSNALIAGIAAPVDIPPGDKEIIAEAQKQIEIMRVQAETQAKLLAEMKANTKAIVENKVQKLPGRG